MHALRDVFNASVLCSAQSQLSFTPGVWRSLINQSPRCCESPKFIRPFPVIVWEVALEDGFSIFASTDRQKCHLRS